jgi:hypothetical protein
MIATMANERKKKEPPKDRHANKALPLRMHPLMRKQLDKLALKNATKATEEARRAIRLLLESEGLWPVADQK